MINFWELWASACLPMLKSFWKTTQQKQTRAPSQKNTSHLKNNHKNALIGQDTKKNVSWKTDAFLITVILTQPTYVEGILNNNTTTTNNSTFTKKSSII